MFNRDVQQYKEYATAINLTLGLMPWETIHRTVELLHHARLSERQIFVMGNGGSASTASHMACDLGKNTDAPGYPRFRVISLVDNMAMLSAYANDVGYENVFAEQLANLLRKGDIVIAISTSGNSPNVLRAIELAKGQRRDHDWLDWDKWRQIGQTSRSAAHGTQ